MTAARALLIVLDSVGIGGASDADAYGDAGADTLGHIAEACRDGAGDRPGLRSGPLDLPHLARLGIGLACRAATGRIPPGLEPPYPVTGAWGAAREISSGKDTPAGHWEIAGAPADGPWGSFPDTHPAFPPALVEALIQEAGLPGILGDRHASGTAIIDELGVQHVRTGRPICYTSADSVFQIAAHEESFGLARLYEICGVARRLCDPLRIGRVIARPFVGTQATGFVRSSAHRRDLALTPPFGSLLDRLDAAGREIVTIGKLGDIFAHRATGREITTRDNDAGIEAILTAFGALTPGGLVFANLVDFDSHFGHRRDVPGYAAALERFDRRIPEIASLLGPGDLAVVTADHGNDPTFRGNDHTREQVPVLVFGTDRTAACALPALVFADIGATLAAHLDLPAPLTGRSVLAALRAPRPA